MKIEYKYVTGETVEVEVGEEWAKILIELDHEEEKNNRKETRRHEHYEDEGEWAIDHYAYIETVMERKELSNNFEEAMDSMTEAQKDLIEKIYFYGMSVNEYAEREGVHPSAISHRIARMKNKFKKIY